MCNLSRFPIRFKENDLKIVIVGTSCSGKTTFARNLAAKINVPHIELDVLHWLPDWQEQDDEHFRRLVQEKIAEHPAWIMDGNYKVIRDLTWGSANIVIWLNYPFLLVFGRALKRTISRIILQKPLFHNNRESFRQAFLSKESIIYWVLVTYKRRIKRYRELKSSAKFKHIHFIEFTHPRQAKVFLADMGFFHFRISSNPE